MAIDPRKQYLEAALKAAEEQISPIHDFGVGLIAWAENKGWDKDARHVRLHQNPVGERERAEWEREVAVFNKAADYVQSGMAVKDNDIGFNANCFAVNLVVHDRDRLTQDRVSALSEFIHTQPHLNEALSEYCAPFAREALAKQAQSSRPSELASPDDALSRRSRGRRM